MGSDALMNPARRSGGGNAETMRERCFETCPHQFTHE